MGQRYGVDPAFGRRNRNNRDSRWRRGSTLMEVMVALAILSALGFGVWLALSGSHGLLVGVAARSAEIRRILQLDTALRREMERVRPPFWIGLPPDAGRGGDRSITLGYLDGDP